MGNWNNLKHFKRNFMLVIVNVIILAFVFCYIPVSSLVMLSMLPAIIYAFYSKRGSLIIITVAVYGIILAIFFLCILQPSTVIELGENVNIIIHLYQAIYPYQINVSILHLLGFTLIFYMTLFIFFTLLISIIIKISEFSAMITFSYAVTVFAAIYLILNVFSFIIPQMQYYMANNVIFQYMFAFFYVILPFLTLNFIVLYLELCIMDAFKRKDYDREAKKLNQHPTKIGTMLTAILVLLIGVFVIVLFGGMII